MTGPKSCVIIGAGMAGLTAGGVLRQRGWEVVVLDRGRSPGGRMATRREGESRFDHGAQFFTVRDSRFREVVDRWEASGYVKPWFTEDEHTRYRGTDGMAGIMKEIAKPFDVRTATKVDRVQAGEKGWRLLTDAGEEFTASTLLLTPPGPQSLALLAGCIDRLPASIVSSLKSIEFDPCVALLATLNGRSGVPPPGYVRPENGPIGFIADNTQKGISTGAPALTIHAKADFTRSNFEMPHEEVAQLLFRAAVPWLGSKVLTWQLHRWRYSHPVATCAEPFLYATEPQPLAVAGDAFGGPRIEGAFLSGLAVARRITAG
jgi:renalase